MIQFEDEAVEIYISTRTLNDVQKDFKVLTLEDGTMLVGWPTQFGSEEGFQELVQFDPVAHGQDAFFVEHIYKLAFDSFNDYFRKEVINWAASEFAGIPTIWGNPIGWALDFDPWSRFNQWRYQL